VALSYRGHPQVIVANSGRNAWEVWHDLPTGKGRWQRHHPCGGRAGSSRARDAGYFREQTFSSQTAVLSQQSQSSAQDPPSG
jgi:hypothetical protein